MEKKLVTVPQMAQKLGCCHETVRRMLRKEEIPGVKVRRNWRMDQEQVAIALSNDQQGQHGDK